MCNISIHESGHILLTNKYGIRVLSAHAGKDRREVISETRQDLSLRDQISTLVAGAVAEQLTVDNRGTHLWAGCGGDTKIILSLLGEPPEKECSYSVVWINSILHKSIPSILKIPAAHITLLAEAVENARQYIQEHLETLHRLAEALQTHDLCQEEIENIIAWRLTCSI